MQSLGRRIVVKAAEEVEDPSTRSWLLEDSRGYFERTATELWEKTAAKRQELKLSDEDSENQVAIVLSLSALEAQLRKEVK